MILPAWLVISSQYLAPVPPGLFYAAVTQAVLNLRRVRPSMPLSVEPPVCGSCRITMLWCNSVRTEGTSDHLTHSFRCPNCNRTEKATVVQATNTPIADDPAHWQKRADEIRKLAETLSDANAREAFIKLAAEYDKLAQRAANRTQKPKPPSGAAA